MHNPHDLNPPRAITVIDSDGFRPNVGIIVMNAGRQVLWAKRVRQDAWQFPQGGIRREETPQEAVIRELHEELGLRGSDVEIVGCTREWLSYRLPSCYVRRGRGRTCIGQKQKWFLLRLTGDEGSIRFDCSGQPEFDDWRWVDWWLPMGSVVEFKREVYRAALAELATLAGVNPSDPPADAARDAA